MSNLADLLQRKGIAEGDAKSLQEAETLYREVLEIRKRVFKKGDRGTLASMDDLISLLEKKGDARSIQEVVALRAEKEAIRGYLKKQESLGWE